MRALYNEIDPFAAEWLRQLIKQGHIADGIVDERSIEDLEPDYVSTFTQVHFFAGIGVWSHALRNSGWSDETPVWTGSCPCQPFSTAGKGLGTADERHLWPAFFHLIDQCRPPVVFGEQVASKDGFDWLDLVSADLEATGYAFGAADLCAAGVGAPHIRQRSFWVAYSKSRGRGKEQPNSRRGDARTAAGKTVLCSGGSRNNHTHPTNGFWRDADWLGGRDGKWRPVESGTFPLVDGLANRVGRLRGYGNAIVAPQAQAFIEAFMEYS